MFDRPNILRPK